MLLIAEYTWTTDFWKWLEKGICEPGALFKGTLHGLSKMGQGLPELYKPAGDSALKSSHREGLLAGSSSCHCCWYWSIFIFIIVIDSTQDTIKFFHLQGLISCQNLTWLFCYLSLLLTFQKWLSCTSAICLLLQIADLLCTYSVKPNSLFIWAHS